MRPDLFLLAKEIHKENEKWWRNPATAEWIHRDVGEMCMLMISEIAEAMEGLRKNLMDDHLPHRKMEEVELADAVIRLFDFCGQRKIDPTPQPHYVSDITFAVNEAENLRRICLEFAFIAEYIQVRRQVRHIQRALFMIEEYAGRRGYDLWAAVDDKRAYNRVRPDHKPEARLQAHGKKF